MYSRNQSNKSKLSLYKLLFHIKSGSTQATRQSISVIKVDVVGVGICILRCLKEELA